MYGLLNNLFRGKMKRRPNIVSFILCDRTRDRRDSFEICEKLNGRKVNIPKESSQI